MMVNGDEVNMSHFASAASFGRHGFLQKKAQPPIKTGITWVPGVYDIM